MRVKNSFAPYVHTGGGGHEDELHKLSEGERDTLNNAQTFFSIFYFLRLGEGGTSLRLIFLLSSGWAMQFV